MTMSLLREAVKLFPYGLAMVELRLRRLYRQAAMGRVPNGVRVCAEVGTFRLTFFIYPIIYLIPIESSGFVV